ncbi:MAG TPA: Lrp/AsnC family transcriptional regulator [Ktedonobacteraceae bacterium]|jgi:Lrp/AsnC family leucine-responsive transcriptional regulator|nr:Lrp/AsnC family transcriptional regulator [Ktedonobacteraceae bacterium]
MALEIEKLLDDTGWRLLEALQENARLSYSELGQRVGLSSPAVAERIHRMEDAGIISGYHAQVNVAKIGFPVTAIIRMGSAPGERCTRSVPYIQEIPEVLECYRVTGSDSFILRVMASSVEQLEALIDRLSGHGSLTTSIVLSTPLSRRIITQKLASMEGEEVEATA